MNLVVVSQIQVTWDARDEAAREEEAAHPFERKRVYTFAALNIT
jgi:hypothetical protein